MKLVLVGGLNADSYAKGEAWGAYKAGVVLEVDTNNPGQTRIIYADDTRPNYLPEGTKVSTVFKAATLRDGVLTCCSTTEVFTLDLASQNVLRKLTHPKMNDVHHAIVRSDDTVLVCSTGLDTLMELTWDGSLKRSWQLSAKGTAMINDDIDYREVESTKPHEIHPNFVLEVGSDIYVTRFKQQDAICVTNEEAPSFVIPQGNPHDGVVKDDQVWFTTTNGWVVTHDKRSAEQTKSVNLNVVFQADRPLGWCRSVLPIDQDRFVVGFSRLRKTAFQENVRWAASKLLNRQAAPLPTRIAVVNHRENKVEQQFDLEKAGLLNAIFSIHKSPE